MSRTLEVERLVDYVILVGPGRGVGFESAPPGKSSNSPASFSSWYQVSQPFPTILKHYPATNHKDFQLAFDVAYFCQPEGSFLEMDEQKLHNFMLTDTETNVRTYGICLSVPHLFDPLVKDNKSEEICSLEGEESSVCIQEWGVLSVCILTKHPFLNFFQSCLKTLSHMVEHFCGNDLTWNALIQSQCHNQCNGNVAKFENQCNKSPQMSSPVREIEQWLERLLELRAPLPNESALEVELEVNPAVLVCYPPANRFPLLELPVHELFQRLDVCMVIDIFKLVLSEQKVVVHSADAAFVSTCVLVVVALLYPLQYLFPVIPLLPSSMPSAENLLLVPTPFFIGVCSSFLDKLCEMHRSEAWFVNLDSKEVSPPEFPEEPQEFPFCILQLQADVRRALDYLEPAVPEEPSGRLRYPSTADSYCSSELEAERRSKEDVDVLIRMAFVEFLFSPEILGQVERHLCVFRLFPRPVVALRGKAFMAGYQKASPTTSPAFITSLIKSQGIEYFYEWSLNPTNSAFQEVRKGVLDVGRLSDKSHHFLHRSGVRVEQVCLYSNQNDSLLYQEMLTYKAGEASFDLISPSEFVREDEEDSDWEYLGRADYYDAGSELSMSTPSYYSDYHSRSPSPSACAVLPAEEADLQDVKLQIIGDFQRNGLIDPDTVEVGFYTPKRFSFPDMNVEVVPDSADSVFKPDNSHSLLLPPLQHSLIRPPSSSNLSTSPYLSTPPRLSTSPPPHTSSSPPPPPPPPTDPSSSKRHLLHVPSLGSQGLSHSCEALPFSDSSETAGELLPADDTDYYSPMTLDRSDSFPFARVRSPPYTTPSVKTDADQREYFDDDAILFTRQSVSTRRRSQAAAAAAPRKSWLDSMALSGAAATTEVVEFSTPQSTLRRSSSLRSRKERSAGHDVSRGTPVSAITHSQVLEGQIQELVKRVVEGQGLPWPKPAGLKKLASHEKTRVMVLRQLEVELAVRNPDDLRMATSPQIAVVAVSKPVFRGLLELFKYLLQCVEEDLQKEPEGPIFSIFLILRMAFCVHLKARRQGVSPSSFLALGALRVSSFSISSSQTASQTASNQTASSQTASQTPSQTSTNQTASQTASNRTANQTASHTSTNQTANASPISQTASASTTLKTCRSSDPPPPLLSSQPLSSQTTGASPAARPELNSNSSSQTTGASPAARPELSSSSSSQEDLTLLKEEEEEQLTAGQGERGGGGGSYGDGPPNETLTAAAAAATTRRRDSGGGRPLDESGQTLSPVSNASEHSSTSTITVDESPSTKASRKDFSSSPDRSLQGSRSGRDGDKSPLSGDRTASTTPVADKSSSNTKPLLDANDRTTTGRVSPAPVDAIDSLAMRNRAATLPENISRPGKKTERTESPPRNRELLSVYSAESSPMMQRRNNLTHSVRATSKSPVLAHTQLQHARSESFVPHILALSPRFLQHMEGRDLSGSTFLYKELIKQLGSSKAFMLKKDFWNVLFMSTVSTDRNALGWNEKTEELYQRHVSLSEEHQQAFGLEEDNLLSVLLHNLLVYMLMVGVGQQETTGFIHRFTARSRLATVEEKLLQQTLKHVELHTSSEVDLSDLGLMALYSEVHPTISYIVHYGVCMLAPVYKLQITDEALILRRFPDEKVSSRLWNDCITEFTLSDARSTLSIRYRDNHGEFSHHFHTKQFRRVFESLQEIISSSSRSL